MKVPEAIKRLVVTAVAGYEKFWVSQKVAMKFFIEEKEDPGKEGVVGVRISCSVNDSIPLVIFGEAGYTMDDCYQKIALTLMSQGVASLYLAVINEIRSSVPVEQQHKDLHKMPPFKKLIVQ